MSDGADTADAVSRPLPGQSAASRARGGHQIDVGASSLRSKSLGRYSNIFCLGEGKEGTFI